MKKMLDLNNRILQCNKEIDELKTRIAHDMFSVKVWKAVLKMIGITLLAFVISFPVSGVVNGIVGFFAPASIQDIVLVITVIVVTFIGLCKGIEEVRYAKGAPMRIEKCEEEVKEQEKKLATAKRELATYKSSEEWSKAVSYIPKDYFYLSAITKMKSFAANGRADTMKEALTLYEEFLHREKMEYEAKRAADNAEMTAVAAAEASEYARITAEKAESIEFLTSINAYRTTTIQNNIDIDITFE